MRKNNKNPTEEKLNKIQFSLSTDKIFFNSISSNKFTLNLWRICSIYDTDPIPYKWHLSTFAGGLYSILQTKQDEYFTCHS